MQNVYFMNQKQIGLPDLGILFKKEHTVIKKYHPPQKKIFMK